MFAFVGVILCSVFGIFRPAWAERPAVRFTESGRASLRSKGAIPNEFISRVNLLLLPSSPHWNLAPFVEAGWDFDDSKFSRVALGAEAGVKPFSWWNEKLTSLWFTRPLTWFYVGEALYQRWYKPSLDTDPAHDADKIRAIFPGASHTESDTRFRFDIPTPMSIGSHAVGMYAVDEYIIDLNEGRTIRNEVGAGFKISLSAQHDFGLFLGWRHVDLVHLDDDDQFEGSLQATF